MGLTPPATSSPPLRRGLPHPALRSCPHPEPLTPPARRAEASTAVGAAFTASAARLNPAPRQRHYGLQHPSVPGSLRRQGPAAPLRAGQHWGRTRRPRRSPTKAARRMRRLRRGRQRAKLSAPTSIAALPRPGPARPGAPACPALPSGAGPIRGKGWERERQGSSERDPSGGSQGRGGLAGKWRGCEAARHSPRS